MFCLDTNIVIDLFRGDRVLQEALDKLSKEYIISAVTAAELFKGAYLSERNESVDFVERFVRGAQVLDFTHNAARLFGEKYAQLKKNGKMTQEFDLLIAATALTAGATLVTRNEKEFRNIEGLKLLIV